MKRTLIIITIGLLLHSCKNDDPIGNKFYFTNHYITEYITPNSMELDYFEGQNFSVKFDGEIAMKMYDRQVDIETFDRLSKKYNDLSYDRMVPVTVRALSAGIVSIDISCDRKYNENFSANESLNEIATLRGYSAWKYIQDGYQRSSSFEYIDEGFAVVESAADHLSADDFLLLDPSLRIKLSEDPIEGVNTIKVKVEFDDGTVLTSNITRHMTVTH